MTAQERITEWAALATYATPGPWNYGTPPEGDPADTATYLTGFAIEPTAPCTDVWVVWTPSDTGAIAPAITGDGPTSGPNAAFIAASRAAVPAMAAALTAVLGIPRADVHKADDKEWQRLMSLGYNLALEAAKEAIETALAVTP